MAPIAWKPEYSVGDEAVDHEHRELIDLVNAAAAAIVDRAPEDRIEAGFGDLLRAISAHFAHEERQMRAARYDALAAHKEDHERLLDALRAIMDGASDDPGGGPGGDPEASATRLVGMLEAWFGDHFRTHDSRLHRRLGPHAH